MVVFIIILAGAIVTALTDSTYVAMRLNTAAERRVQAEYMLKSAINFARVLIQDDANPNQDDPVEDLWYPFQNGAAVPGELLGIDIPNLTIQLEIAPEGGKIPVRQLLNTSNDTVNVTWRGVLERLFQGLGFDDDKKEVSPGGRFAGRHFTSQEMVANLIDYMDTDTNSYSDSNFAQGVEGSLPPDEPLRNQKMDSLSELASVPGFTPNRVRVLIPLLTTSGSTFVNVNSARPQVLRSLDRDINDTMVQQIIAFRSDANGGGPFKQNEKREQLFQIVGGAVDNFASLVNTSSSKFQIIAKVDFVTSSFMARAMVTRANVAGQLPDVDWLELY
jgi:type II secretory pathway component PulK